MDCQLMKNRDAVYGFNPWNVPYAAIREKEKRHSSILQKLDYKVVRIYTCQFNELKKYFTLQNFEKLTGSSYTPSISFQEFEKYFYQKQDLRSLHIRQVVKGGRTEVYSYYWSKLLFPLENAYYYDINS